MALSNLRITAIRAEGDGAVADIALDTDSAGTFALEIDDNPGFIHPIGNYFQFLGAGTLSWQNIPAAMAMWGSSFGYQDDIPLLSLDQLFALDYQYYWRIRTGSEPPYEYSEVGPVIDTSNISTLPWGPNDIAPYPFNMTVTTPEQSEANYGVLFGWLGIAGSGWILDYSGYEDYNDAASIDVSGMDYLASEFVFTPDVTYYWRIRLNDVVYDGNSFTVPFGTPPDDESTIVVNDEYPYAEPESGAAPVSEPSDLPNAAIGTKLRTIAQKIRDARAHMRAWAEQ